MKKYALLFVYFISSQSWAGIPATPVMTLYRFNGDLEIPFFNIETFARTGSSSPAGALTQGTSVIPCLVIRNGRPLTDSGGTPFVGFQVVVDSRKATPASTDKFKQAVARRQAMTVANHHCDNSVRHVINVRKLFELEKAPFFDPPVSAELNQARNRTNVSLAVNGCKGQDCSPRDEGQRRLDAIIRAFHNSPRCEQANEALIGRRSALGRAWSRFIADHQRQWSDEALRRARQLDFTLRTAIFEGHLDRGCNAYGACERNVIALSIRNRARESCLRRQGCGAPGDFEGVSSKVSQYNIWDEFLTQISGLTSCFLRRDLGGGKFTLNGKDSPKAAYYDKIRRIYEQSLGDVAQILFGDDRDLKAIFPNVSLRDLKTLRHYYHAPAMGKCFPDQDRVEYISGAVARKGSDFALVAGTRIHVDRETQGGYFFHEFVIQEEPDRDVTALVDNYPGFVVDGRKVDLRGAPKCYPYGIPRGCKFKQIGRYRKTPNWLHAGKPLELECKVRDRGENCRNKGQLKTVSVGGTCDTQMRPVAGVR